MMNYILNWLSRPRHSENKTMATAADDYRTFKPIVELCSLHIAKALNGFNAMDRISVCRTHRETLNLLSATKRSYHMSRGVKQESVRIYVDFLREVTGKIVEMVRFIVTMPESNLTIADKCELLALKDIFLWIHDNCPDSDSGETKYLQYIEGISNNRSFVKLLISEHSESMRHHGFEEEAISYPILTLLYDLHSLLNSLEKALKVISTS